MTQAHQSDLLATRVPSDQVVASPVGDSMVLLDLRSGTYHTLNGVGSFIWGAVERGATLGGIVDDLCTEYQVERSQALADAEQFLAEIDAAGLTHRP